MKRKWKRKVTVNKQVTDYATSRIPAEYQPLLKVIVDMRNVVESDAVKLANANPQWDRDRDARLKVFSNTIAAIESAMVGILFTKGILPEDRFWSKSGLAFHHESPEVMANKKREVEATLENFVKVGFIQVQFAVTESAMRIFLRALDANACSRGTAAFKTIYDCLLKKLSKPIPDAVSLLDLWREVRNVIHNNGVYFNKDGADKTLVYKGKTYEFRYGQAVNFVDWSMCVKTAWSVIELLFAVVNDDVIKNHPRPILDPSAL